MKRLLPISIFLLMTVLYACEKDNIAYSDQYKRSYSAWINFKTSCNNSYRYVTYTTYRGELRSGMEIIVQDGVVTEQGYYQLISKHDGTMTYDTVMLWRETGAEVGTHFPAAKVLTLDDVYDLARTEWLIKRDNTSEIIKTELNGMISVCGYEPHGHCPVDCFHGIRIREITPL